MELTDGVPSPDQFRLWSAIALVAGALERRVWARAARAKTFPNVYVLLTAAPGVGKQVVALVEQLWRSVTEPGAPDVPVFKIAPSQMTKAALVDAMAKSEQLRILRDTVSKQPVNAKYSSLLIAAEEFQVLLPTYDTEYISTLNLIFNNPEVPYQEVRRTGSVKNVSIVLPQLNIIAGVQPSYFTQTFPEEAWTTGLARRIIMIYAAEAPFQDLFQVDQVDCVEHPLWEGLRAQLGQLSVLYGQMSWEPAAAEKLADWHKRRGPPTPTHSKLTGYNNSRTMFAIKLSIIAAAARSGEMIITEADVKRALTWLVTAEARMPDVFREMVGKSDSQIIDELHYMMVLEQSRSKKALSTAQLWEFLRQRVPSEKIEKILLSAERAGVISRAGGAPDLWTARPIGGVRGVE